jgi:Hsp20/alpha crystallin family
MLRQDPFADIQDLLARMTGLIQPTGETGAREEEEGSTALRVRRGRFHYHTSLPSDVDADNVEASMDGGVLTLRIPKARQSQGHRIEISNGKSKSERGGTKRRS